MAEGHKCAIATHPEYAKWVSSYGIEHRSAGGDPGLLMEISVDHKIFDPETKKRFRSWFADLLKDSYRACQKGTDVLIESPSTFAGVHIAEALAIPYIRAFTMPWSKTAEFPQPFIGGPAKLNRVYNMATYALFNSLIWRASSGQINKWRTETLQIPKTDWDSLHISSVPFCYNFSSHVVPRPLDWPSSTYISGYWNLETKADEYDPPQDLVKFIQQARADKKPLVYLGFGSITIPDPDELTRNVIKSVQLADVRMILCKGWSARRAKTTLSREATQYIPDEVGSAFCVRWRGS